MLIQESVTADGIQKYWHSNVVEGGPLLKLRFCTLCRPSKTITQPGTTAWGWLGAYSQTVLDNIVWAQFQPVTELGPEECLENCTGEYRSAVPFQASPNTLTMPLTSLHKPHITLQHTNTSSDRNIKAINLLIQTLWSWEEKWTGPQLKHCISTEVTISLVVRIK